MSAPKGVGTCRHLDVSARVSTFSGVGTFEVLTHVSTSQLPNNIHMSARVGTCLHKVCRHLCWHVPAPWCVDTSWLPHLSRCRHLSRCWHLPAHPSIQAKINKHVTPWFKVSARVGTERCQHNVGTIIRQCRHHLRCRHLRRCWHMSAHP